MVIPRLASLFEGDDTVTDVNATLGGYLQVAFDDIAQVGVAIEIRTGFILEWL